MDTKVFLSFSFPHLHLVENGRPVVGDDNLSVSLLDHLVHAPRSEGRPDRVRERLGGLYVRDPDLHLPRVIPVSCVAAVAGLVERGRSGAVRIKCEEKKKRRRGGQTPGSDSQIPRRSRPDRRVSQRSPLRPRRPPPPFLGAFDTSVPKTRRTHRKVSPFLPPPAFGATMVSACSRLLEWPLRLCEGLGEAGCTDIPARARSWKKYPWREDFV